MNDEFENSIRNKLNEADIPFDQDAWTKMEALLDADNQPKTPVAWWWLMLLPILGGLVWWSIQSIGVNENNVEAVVQAPASPKAAVQIPCSFPKRQIILMPASFHVKQPKQPKQAGNKPQAIIKPFLSIKTTIPLL